MKRLRADREFTGLLVKLYALEMQIEFFSLMATRNSSSFATMVCWQDLVRS